MSTKCKMPIDLKIKYTTYLHSMRYDGEHTTTIVYRVVYMFGRSHVQDLVTLCEVHVLDPRPHRIVTLRAVDDRLQRRAGQSRRSILRIQWHWCDK